MDLTHEFTVPATKAETWAALNDLESVAGCFPGASITSVEGDTFTGSCKVKLGPIALVYNGSGSFTEKDEAAGVMKIQAKGKDKRGNGTAGADVVATMSEVSDTETKVVVVTDLNITGKPAQFGRGVIQDISDKLLGQFVDCLKTKVGGEPDQDAGPASAPTGAAAAPEEALDQDSGPASVPQQAVAGGTAGASATSSASPSSGAATTGGSTSRPAQAAASSGSGAQSAGSDDALDLGATVIPILLKTYGKQLAAGLGVLALILWVARRR